MDKDGFSKLQFEKYICNCKDLLENIPPEYFGEKCSPWFKNICDLLVNILIFLESELKYLKITTQEVMLLHVFQFASALSLLVEVFKSEAAKQCVLHEARKCAIKQLLWCLDGLSICQEGFPNNSGSFIKWMDVALDALNAIDIEKGSAVASEACKSSKGSIEEVLSYAMSIAQVVASGDSDSIKGGCRTVLEELESLCQQCCKAEPNVAMCNLFVANVTTKLCTVEERVNNSVLRLCLHVFSSCTKHLDELVAFCDSSDFKTNKDNAELDNLVASFDLHVDRIMQIGFFAIACSSDYNRVIKMQSCLASLEAMEGELVPSLTALATELSLAQRIEAKTLSIILQKYWIKEVNALKNLVYLILDPAAFCKIVYEEVSTFIENLQENIKSAFFKLETKHFNILVDQMDVLVDMVETFLEDATNFRNKDVSQDNCNILKSLTNEVKIASTVLLAESYLKDDGAPRIMKRCNILISKIYQLWTNLTTYTNEDLKSEAENLNETFSNYGKDLIGLDNSKQTKLKLLNENQNTKPVQIPKLDCLEMKGNQILKERSILYRTPHKTIHFSFSSKKFNQKPTSIFCEVVRPFNTVPRKLHFHNHSNFSRFPRNDQGNSTMNLQITDILENLSHLSNTFSLATKI